MQQVSSARSFQKAGHLAVPPGGSERIALQRGNRVSAIERDISFILEIDKLKNVFRKTRNISNDRFENDAEHSWHICAMALTLQQYSNVPVDISRVLQMLIVHDLGEIYGGDIIVYAKSIEAKQSELESVQRVFSMLGTLQQKEFYDLVLEFETRATNEAKYANAVDRMEPILQNIHGNGETWKKNGISYARVVDVNCTMIREGSQELWNYLIEKIDQMREKHLVE
jgi:putative hydrolases of HD superfamily